VPGLGVAAAGREPGGVEDARDDVVGHRFVGEFAHRPGAAQRLDKVHAVILARSGR